MALIKASSPTKAIIAGEHSVVYGGIAIAAPLENRKTCECRVEKAPSGQISFDDSMGIGTYFEDGTFMDKDGFFKAKVKLTEHILKSEKKAIAGLGIKMKLSKNAIPKGTGHSSATAAVIALCLYEAIDARPTKDKLFEAIQVFEEVAHNGKSSGIDAQTVLSDGPIKFKKLFLEGGAARYNFEKTDLNLPRGTTLLIVNTLKKGQIPKTTGEMLDVFVKTRRISKRPYDLNESEREDITKEFDEIVQNIESELNIDGNAKKLGDLFDDNHRLLRKSGVSSDSIEEAIKICLKANCLGAKITGAGGNGGAVLALAHTKDARKVITHLKRAGMDAIEAKFSGKPAFLEI